MLVDLGRNDVGRVAEYGSVRVPEFEIVEYYSHVMHIVSSVLGTLRADKDAFDTLKACFPAGTVSGAPKVRGDGDHRRTRADQAGSLFGQRDVFRFLGHAHVGHRDPHHDGARREGIPAGRGRDRRRDSVPEREWDETMNKAGALLKAVEHAREL